MDDIEPDSSDNADRIYRQTELQVAGSHRKRKIPMRHSALLGAGCIGILGIGITVAISNEPRAYADDGNAKRELPVVQHAVKQVLEGRRVFRFDTFGDEAF